MKKPLLLCLLSALLLILSFPNFNLWILAWFGFVPLFLAIRDKSPWKAFLLSYLTGVVFWFGIIYWLAQVTFGGMVVLVLYLALYFGIFGLLFLYANRKPQTANLLIIPCAWVILEYIRGWLFTGFPWALLAYSQSFNLPIIQIADITGAWGVSFLLMLVNVAVYSVIGLRLSVCGGRQKLKYFLLPLSIIIITLIYGYYQLYRKPNTATRAPIRISVIQPNISQELKWDIQARDFIINKHFALTEKAAQDRPNLIIWPEAAMPVILENEPQYYRRITGLAKRVGVNLLSGAVTLRENTYYNSAILISNTGEVLAAYDKLHLVPFGEYIPLREIFPFLETIVPIGDFAAGSEHTVFTLTDNGTAPSESHFSVLICFEDVFAALSRNFVKLGADFLVNITNDAWFGKTSSPYQHLQASVFRAIENRIPLIRSANTGISAFIAPSGRILSIVKDSLAKSIYVEGYKTQEFKIENSRPSFYTRYGDIFILVCLLLTIYGIISSFKKKR